MPKNRKREKAFPVGLFILMTLGLLIGGVVWLRGAAMNPAYRFYVAYKDPDRITEGAPVYFRGVQVGRVSEVKLHPSMEYTYVHVGIQDPSVVMPRNARIFVRVEGITGQRFLDIEEGRGRVPSEAFIRPNEVVRGTENVTWDRIQEQIARIAEERTLEKILVSTERTMSQLEGTSKDLRKLAARADVFFDNVDPAARRALNQFADASSEVQRAATQAQHSLPRIAGAAESFGGFFGEGGGSTSFNESFRELASAAHQFNTNTAGANDAFAAVRQAADRFGSTFETINTQLIGSNLIPNLSTTTQQVGGSLQSIGRLTGKASPAISPEMQQLNRLVVRLETEGKALEESIRQAVPPNSSATRNPALETLAAVSIAAQETAEAVRPELGKTSDPQVVRQQLDFLADSAVQINTALTEIPLQSLPNSPVMRSQVRGMASTVAALEGHIEQIEPTVSQWVRPAGGGNALGFLGDIGGTLSQVRQTAERFDCVGAQTSRILSQRFLGFKLFFGKPGAGFDQCRQPAKAVQSATRSESVVTPPKSN